MCVNRKRVARIMGEEGRAGAPRRRFRCATTDSAHARPVAPNLFHRDFSVSAPNAASVLLAGRLRMVYLAVLIDLYSRRVVGWVVSPPVFSPRSAR